MTTSAPSNRAVFDPIGLIAELVAAVEPVLTCEQVREVVTAVGAGRAKARRLAAALAQRPGVGPADHEGFAGGKRGPGAAGRQRSAVASGDLLGRLAAH